MSLLSFGIEAQDDPAACGDATEELKDQLQTCDVQSAWRVGRVFIPAGLSCDVPACAKFILKNSSDITWPQSTCIVNVSGDAYGFHQMPLGSWQPGEVAEVVMDLRIPCKPEPTGQRSAWAIVDIATGRAIGPLVLLEVFWQRTQ